MKNIIVVGAKGQAKVTIDAIEREGKYRVVGLVDDFFPKHKSVLGYPVLGKVKELKCLSEKYEFSNGIIAIGNNWIRHQVFENMLRLLPGFIFPAIVHPSAVIGKNVQIGEGTILLAGSIVNVDAVIGKQCIVNTSASLDHDGIMEDFTNLAPHAATGGDVTIEKFTYVGLGAKIKHKVTIHDHCVIGMGSIVLRDIPSHSLVYGSPAQIIRIRKPSEQYL